MTPEPPAIASPLCRALCALLEFLESESHWWIGLTPAKLLACLRKHGGEAVSASGFPRNAQRLGMALNKERAALREAGIIAAYRRTNRGRLWMIGRASEFPDEAALIEVFATPTRRDSSLDEYEYARELVGMIEEFFRIENGC